MTQYFVDFNNETKQTWTMSVYQTLPHSIGLDSVAWKKTTAPQGGQTGVKWDVDFNVALAEYVQIGGIGVYKSSQTLSSLLGKSWDCIMLDKVQQLVPNEKVVDPNTILINNISNALANLGIGMSGQASIFKQKVVSGASAQFTVTPTYYVGLFNDVLLGEVISSNVIVGPQELKYPDGQNLATLTAYMSGSSIKYKVDYSVGDEVDLQVIDRLLSSQPERSPKLLEFVG
jgi:hypothetical protein